MLILHPDYKSFIDDSYSYLNIVYLNEWDDFNLKCDIAIIYNISKVDLKYINCLSKNNSNFEFYTIVHEPWSGWRRTFIEFLKHDESFKETIKRIGRMHYLKRLIRKKSNIIFCSKNAQSIFKYKRKKINSYVMPLVFKDELNTILSNDDKKYFSFIGNASVSHGFNDFVLFIKKYRNTDLKFQIATSTNIEQFLDSDLKKMIEIGQLIVIHGKYLTNEEINECYARASVLWLYYKRTTQSGCLCKAFMFGTPVICSNKGSFSEYINENNGRIVNNFELIYDAYCELINQKNNIDNCRSSFIDFFDCENKVNYLENIIFK